MLFFILPPNTFFLLLKDTDGLIQPCSRFSVLFDIKHVFTPQLQHDGDVSGGGPFGAGAHEAVLRERGPRHPG